MLGGVPPLREVDDEDDVSDTDGDEDDVSRRSLRRRFCSRPKRTAIGQCFGLKSCRVLQGRSLGFHSASAYPYVARVTSKSFGYTSKETSAAVG